MSPSRKLRRLLRRYPFLRLLLLIIVIWTLGALLLWLFERNSNSDFDTLARSFWNIAVYLFSGLDSGVPQTTPGKIAVTIVLVMSLGVVAVFTGSIASFIVESRLGEARRMPDYDLQNHIVVCNWNDKGIPIIQELHADIVRDRRPVVVVSDQEGAAALPEEDEGQEFEDVYLVKGDPAKETILRRANAHRAHSVIILARPEEGELADARSILIAMTVKSLCIEQGVEKTHMCVEVASAENVEHLQRAGADEIVSASDFAMMLLSQAALSHGLSKVYRDLLTVSEETNEVYIVPLPKEFVGKTFEELGAAMFAARSTENPATLIGVVTGKGIQVNPRPGEVPTLAEGDKAVVVAFEYPKQLLA